MRESLLLLLLYEWAYISVLIIWGPFYKEVRKRSEVYEPSMT